MKKLICILMIFYSFNAHAQAGDTGDGDGVVADVPVDGGISLLLAAGAAYGVRRVRRRSKREDGENP